MEAIETIAAILLKKGCFMYNIQVSLNVNLDETFEKTQVEEPMISGYSIYFQLPPQEGEVSDASTIAKRKRMISGKTLDACLEGLIRMEKTK
jgi:hypothetical protein